MSSSLTIVTRKSPLAMWQASFVQQQLTTFHPELNILIKGISTQGDRLSSTPLYEMGGKSVFIKELEQALLDQEADIAVHSLKDMPAALPAGLVIGAIMERADPWDAWACPAGHTWMTLPAGSVVGTSSLRRRMQLGRLRSDLIYQPLRGNVDTRLKKCLAGEWDAIVLAVAGLSRLGLQAHITAVFNEQQVLPAVAQGALGVECRAADDRVQSLLAPLHHALTANCVTAERAMSEVLGGSCDVPIGGYAKYDAGTLHLTARVGEALYYDMLETSAHQSPEETPVALGQRVAQQLLGLGAQRFLNR